MSDVPTYAAGEFCFHGAIHYNSHRLAGIGHSSCWGPQYAFQECSCGATVEVKR